eukprot:2710995-Prymnesium_polylepis.1
MHGRRRLWRRSGRTAAGALAGTVKSSAVRARAGALPTPALRRRATLGGRHGVCSVVRRRERSARRLTAGGPPGPFAEIAWFGTGRGWMGSWSTFHSRKLLEGGV